MAESLSDSRLASFNDLTEVTVDCFGRLFEGKRAADGSPVIIRLLDMPCDPAAVKKCVAEADPNDFLTEVEVVDSTLIVTSTAQFESIGKLNRVEGEILLPIAEFEALGIVGAVLPKLLAAEKDHRFLVNLRPNLLFVKRLVQGRPPTGQPSHTLRIAEPYQHALVESSEDLTDPYLSPGYKTSGENLLSYSLGCLMHHLVFGEAMQAGVSKDNSSISYLYTHYMFQLSKSNGRERPTLASFERSQRTLKDCECLILYPTSKVTNLLTGRGFYSGEMRYGLMHGRGAFTAHKDVYSGLDVAATEGYYCQDKLHMRGSICYKSGERYEGAISWDQPRGEGILSKVSGTTVRGEWEGSTLVDGTEGEIVIPDYSSYRGQVSKNQPHGEGLMVYHDGLVYKGEFKLGQRHGKGKIHKQHGETTVYQYEGDWYENEKHGDGQEVAGDLRYTGQWHLGKKHGQGTLVNTAEDGWTYEGEFRQDQYSGLGMLTKDDGEKYNGEFKSGKRHGYGCCEYTDGSVFDGQWENDLPHGEGSITDIEGNTTMGYWHNGEQVDFDA